MGSLQENLQAKEKMDLKLKHYIQSSDCEINSQKEEISKLQAIIDLQLQSNAETISDDQLFECIIGMGHYLKPVIKLLQKEILAGHLPDILKTQDDISYWFNSGFKSGHARRIGRYMKEDHAHERAVIKFSNTLRDNPELVTDAVIQAILAKLENVLSEMKVCTDWLPFKGEYITLDLKYYRYLQPHYLGNVYMGDVRGPDDALVLHDKDRYFGLKLSNWDLTQFKSSSFK